MVGRETSVLHFVIQSQRPFSQAEGRQNSVFPVFKFTLVCRFEGVFYYTKMMILTMGLGVIECSPSTHEARAT